MAKSDGTKGAATFLVTLSMSLVQITLTTRVSLSLALLFVFLVVHETEEGFDKHSFKR